MAKIDSIYKSGARAQLAMMAVSNAKLMDMKDEYDYVQRLKQQDIKGYDEQLADHSQTAIMAEVFAVARKSDKAEEVLNAIRKIYQVAVDSSFQRNTETLTTALSYIYTLATFSNASMDEKLKDVVGVICDIVEYAQSLAGDSADDDYARLVRQGVVTARSVAEQGALPAMDYAVDRIRELSCGGKGSVQFRITKLYAEAMKNFAMIDTNIRKIYQIAKTEGPDREDVVMDAVKAIGRLMTEEQCNHHDNAAGYMRNLTLPHPAIAASVVAYLGRVATSNPYAVPAVLSALVPLAGIAKNEVLSVMNIIEEAYADKAEFLDILCQQRVSAENGTAVSPKERVKAMVDMFGKYGSVYTLDKIFTAFRRLQCAYFLDTEATNEINIYLTTLTMSNPTRAIDIQQFNLTLR